MHSWKNATQIGLDFPVALNTSGSGAGPSLTADKYH